MGRLFLQSGDITSDIFLSLADAIVNPTNPMMRCGAGVSGAIFKKAGVDLLEAYTERKFGISYYNKPGENEMKVTDIRITPGFNLPCDIIFAQGPRIWDYENYNVAEQLLLNTYINIFMVAVQKGYKSILMPALGTGDYGFSHEQLAPKIMPFICSVINELPFDIYYILFDEDTEKLYWNYVHIK